MTHTQEFLNGWTAAERDAFEGNARRHDFPPYRAADFITGCRSFWAKYDDDLAIAEMDCIADFDARVQA